MRNVAFTKGKPQETAGEANDNRPTRPVQKHLALQVHK